MLFIEKEISSPWGDLSVHLELSASRAKAAHRNFAGLNNGPYTIEIVTAQREKESGDL